MTRSERQLLGMGLAVLAGLIASGIKPYDRITWIMEVAPVLIAVPVLFVTRRRFPLTPLLYALICVHCLVLILGTQGDHWDTQSDMFLAMLGAVAGLALFSKMHDRQIAALRPA